MVQCHKLSPVLYSINSSYLKQIRDILPSSVRKALFLLITEHAKTQFNSSSEESRKTFQIKVDKLVCECTSLITIEHLVDLAAEIEREKNVNIEKVKKEISNDLLEANESCNEIIEDEVNSIFLSLTPPIEDKELLEGWSKDIEINTSINLDRDLKEIKNMNNEEKKKIDDSFLSNLNGEKDKEKEKEKDYDNHSSQGFRSSEFDLLKSIFSIAGQAINSKRNLENENDDISEENSQTRTNINSTENERLLPDSALGLSQWMNSIEIALIRRLRDLSHSINVELLRSGLVNTLVPINLLDAIIAGQLIPENSVSNIVHMSVPMNGPILSEGMEISCILIRPSDLEFDHPSLRKLRSNLRQYRNILIKMVKQQHYWQSRSLANEVREQWWQNTKEIPHKNHSEI